MSHADNYGLTEPYKTVALFGANGQIGDRILNALINVDRPNHEFKIIAFIPPETQLQSGQGAANVSTKTFDLTKVTREELASALQGVDAVVSALNGKALEVQSLIQDAAADAGVKRFVPSEFGMHHIHRKPGDPKGYIHPAWNQKNE
jgi:putative NADH-flavin reductase